MEVGGGQGIGHGVGSLHIRRVLVAGSGDLRKVGGAGHIAVVVQAVHTGKVGVGAAQLFGPLVHFSHKRRQAAAGQVAGDDTGCIVGAGHQQAVQKVDAAHLFPNTQVHGAAVGVLDILKFLAQAVRDGDLRLQVPATFQQQQGGHHLGQAGDITGLGGVLLQNRLAGGCIKQIHRLRIADRPDGHGIGRKTLQRCQAGQQDRQQQRRCTAADR